MLGWVIIAALAVVVTVVLGSFTPFLLSFYALKHLTATAAGIVATPPNSVAVPIV